MTRDSSSHQAREQDRALTQAVIRSEDERKATDTSQKWERETPGRRGKKRIKEVYNHARKVIHSYNNKIDTGKQEEASELLQEAEKLINGVRSKHRIYDKANILCIIAVRYSSSGNKKKATSLLAEAEKLSRKVWRMKTRNGVLSEIAAGYVKNGQIKKAVEITKAITENNRKANQQKKQRILRRRKRKKGVLRRRKK